MSPCTSPVTENVAEPGMYVVLYQPAYLDVTGPGRDVVLDSLEDQPRHRQRAALRPLAREGQEDDETEDHDGDGKQGAGRRPDGRGTESSCLSGAPAGDRQVYRGYDEVHEGADGEGDQERRTDGGEDDLDHVGQAGHESPEDAHRLDDEDREVGPAKDHGHRGRKRAGRRRARPRGASPLADRVGSAIATLRQTDLGSLEIQRAEGSVEP